MTEESQIRKVSTPAIRADAALGTRQLAIPDGNMPPGTGTRAGDPKPGTEAGTLVLPRDLRLTGLRGRSHLGRLHQDGVPEQGLATPSARPSPQLRLRSLSRAGLARTWLR